MNAKDKTIALVSLGCDKNTVDSERILYIVKNAGFNITSDLSEANIIILNTCAFILDAQQESIDSILDAEQYKNNGTCEKIIVCSCLVARNGSELQSAIPNIDLLVNINEYDKIPRKIFELYSEENFNVCELPMEGRVLSTPQHYAYVKIADGCDNFCTYCTIPKIRGRFRSRKIEDIVSECEGLAQSGVRELIIVAQDVTRYGIDLYGEYKIVELVEKLTQISGVKWVRLHYCYPELISDELIDLIASNDKICKYVDLPLQHVSTNVLKKMNRKSTYESICALIDKIRSKPCKISIRASFIVGFPNETEQDFEQLSDFVKEYKLDNVGVFQYSREEGTPAYSMPNQVLAKVKKQRQKEIYQLQQAVVKEHNEEMIGKTIVAVCDDVQADCLVLRSEYNSPSIETVIYCDCVDGVEQGKYYNVEITGYDGYDLIGAIKGEAK